MKKLSEETINKIREANKLGYSTRKSAAYANVSVDIIRHRWKMLGLGLNYKPLGSTLPEEKIWAIIEAYKSCSSTQEAAELVGVYPSTVLKYWKKAGLKFKDEKRLSENQKERIYEAHSNGMSIKGAARHADVNVGTVKRYWQRNDLEAPKYIPPIKPSISVLIDDVFEKPDESLTLDNIKSRLEDKLHTPINEIGLFEGIDFLTNIGVYTRKHSKSRILYQPGMPKAMGMSLESEFGKPSETYTDY